MTRTKIVALGVVTIVVIGAIAIAVTLLAGNALGASPHQSVSTTCSSTKNDYIVTIENSKLSIDDVHARLCDKLTIVNNDKTIRLIAFGAHDHHQPYDGIGEKALSQGQSLSVTLNQAGTFIFHDHIHDEVKGTFTVE